METVICDSELSQLSFSTTSAHSANAQPFQKRKSPLIFRGRKKPAAEKDRPAPDSLIKNLRIREKRFGRAITILILDNNIEFVLGPDGYSAKLFSNS